jgi:hypothetical protein
MQGAALARFATMEMRNFIEKVRNSNRQTRKRYLVIFSASASFLIIIIWAVYLNSLLGFFKQDQEDSSTPAQAGVFSTFMTGLGNIGKNIKEKTNETFGTIKDQLSKENEVILENNSTTENN